MPQTHSESQNIYEQFIAVRKALSETTAGFWTDLEIYHELNQAQRHIAIKSRCLKKTVTITTVASTQEYDLKDNSFADIIDIADDGVYFKIAGTSYIPLKKKTKKQLAMESPGWQGVAAGTPTNYYYDKASKTIGLYPKPNSTNAGAYLFITGYHLPKVLLGGTASSGSTTTIVFASGSATVPYPNPANDYYNNLWLEIYGDTGAGQKCEITDYVGATKTATISVTTAPDNTSEFGMIPQIPESAHYLMPLYALWKIWPKGGSRTLLGEKYKKDYYEGLSEFIGEFIFDENEEIIKDTYR